MPNGLLYSNAGTVIIWGLLIFSMILSLWAQMRVKSAYSKYAQVRNSRGITGAQAARAILDANGLNSVVISQISGTLTDHYDPRSNVISLSSDIYNGTSVAAVGIASHEVGHAIQHHTNYAPVKLRSAMVPAVNFSGKLSWIFIAVGLLISSMSRTPAGYYIAVAGVILFSLTTIFELVTLPVELDASRRALAQINNMFAPSDDERKGMRKVLTAAAMTYLAALISSIASLLRVISIVGRRRN